MNIYKTQPEDILHNLRELNQVVFEVTEACNLKCDYCIYSELYGNIGGIRSNRNIKFEIIKNTIDYLISIWGGRSEYTKPIFISFYGGEPLMNMPIIKKAISYIDEHVHNRRIVYSMTTNAMLLDKHMDFLHERNFSLLISLDGDSNANIHRQTISNKESFGQVYGNIIKLKEKYPSYFNTNVNFNTVLTSSTSLDQIVEFFKDNFDKVPQISQIKNLDIKDKERENYNDIFQSIQFSYSCSNDMESLDTKLFLSSPFKKQLINYLLHFSGNSHKRYSNLFINRQIAPTLLTGTCIPFGKKMFITANGDILQCEKIDHKFSLGKVTESSFDLDIDKVAEQFNQYVLPFRNQCSSCSKKNACSQCVFQLESFNNGEYNCTNHSNKSDFNHYENSNLLYLKKKPHLYEAIINDYTLN